MSSNRQKGYRRERQAVEIYQSAGFVVEKSVSQRHGRTDWFGLIDLMAIRPDEVRFTQVKSNVAGGIADINKWADAHAPEWIQFDVLVAHDNQGWRLLELDPANDTHTAVIDEREQNCKMGESVIKYLDQER